MECVVRARAECPAGVIVLHVLVDESRAALTIKDINRALAHDAHDCSIRLGQLLDLVVMTRVTVPLHHRQPLDKYPPIVQQGLKFGVCIGGSHHRSSLRRLSYSNLGGYRAGLLLNPGSRLWRRSSASATRVADRDPRLR
jgi:hypothetical protein